MRRFYTIPTYPKGGTRPEEARTLSGTEKAALTDKQKYIGPPK